MDVHSLPVPILPQMDEQIDIGPQGDEEARKLNKYPDLPFSKTCWKVISSTPSTGTPVDYPSCVCDTWKCQKYQVPTHHHIGLGGDPGWMNNPQTPTYAYGCFQQVDGQGPYYSKSACKKNCNIKPLPTGHAPDQGEISQILVTQSIDSNNDKLLTAIQKPKENSQPTMGSEISESKKLRKLIKKWRKNNL